MIQLFYPQDVTARAGGSLKINAFQKVIRKVQEVVFGIDLLVLGAKWPNISMKLIEEWEQKVIFQHSAMTVK